MKSPSPSLLMAAIGVVALVVVVGIMMPDLRSRMKSAQRTSKEASVSVPAGVAAQDYASSAVPVASAGVRMPQSESYQRIYDSRDILATVLAIDASGAPDEKGWASDILRECVAFTRAPQLPQGLPKAQERQRLEAWNANASSCAGVATLSREDRRLLVDRLKTASQASTSAFGILSRVASKAGDGERRLNSEERAVLANGLYDPDRVVRRAAFGALATSVDRDSPGGDDRNMAIYLVAGDTGADQDDTEFRKNLKCIIFGACSGESSTDASVQLSANLERVKREYANAVARRASLDELLSIR
jgi:hypothetical protein